MSLQIVEGELASKVVEHLGVKERIEQKIPALAAALTDALDDTKVDFEISVLHQCVILVVSGNNNQFKKAVGICEEAGMSEEDAQTFMANAALSELMRSEAFGKEFLLKVLKKKLEFK